MQQRTNGGADFGIEMSDYNMEGGNVAGPTPEDPSLFDNLDHSTDTRTFMKELRKGTGIFEELKRRGLAGYWTVQSVASKITHALVALLGMVLTINFCMAVYTHFFWDRAYLGKHLGDDEIMILYCQTQGCGCENGVLHRLQKLIKEHFAGDEGSESVKVHTQLYPGAPLIQFFARCAQLMQVLCLITIFFGPMICRKVYKYGANTENKNSIRYPYFVEKLAVGGCLKKLGMFLLCFIGFNIIVALMTITGAFEIYHGQELVFSSLDSKRMVTPNDLITTFPRLDGKESPLMKMKNLNTPVGHMH